MDYCRENELLQRKKKENEYKDKSAAYILVSIYFKVYSSKYVDSLVAMCYSYYDICTSFSNLPYRSLNFTKGGIKCAKEKCLECKNIKCSNKFQYHCTYKYCDFGICREHKLNNIPKVICSVCNLWCCDSHCSSCRICKAKICLNHTILIDGQRYCSRHVYKCYFCSTRRRISKMKFPSIAL